jgi:hypothetical protein
MSSLTETSGNNLTTDQELLHPADKALAAILEGRSAAARQQHRQGPPSIVLALDATASRGPAWERAQVTQSAMFREAAKAGLNVKLGFFRGDGEQRQCQFSNNWIGSAEVLARVMTKVEPRAGYTQWGRIFRQAIKEAEARPVQALIIIGDSFEVASSANPSGDSEETVRIFATRLRALDTRVFAFHETTAMSGTSERMFRDIARDGGGAFFKFQPGAERHLAELFGAVGAYAAGGLKALAGRKDAAAVKLLEQLK